MSTTRNYQQSASDTRTDLAPFVVYVGICSGGFSGDVFGRRLSAIGGSFRYIELEVAFYGWLVQFQSNNIPEPNFGVSSFFRVHNRRGLLCARLSSGCLVLDLILKRCLYAGWGGKLVAPGNQRSTIIDSGLLRRSSCGFVVFSSHPPSISISDGPCQLTVLPVLCAELYFC